MNPCHERQAGFGGPPDLDDIGYCMVDLYLTANAGSRLHMPCPNRIHGSSDTSYSSIQYKRIARTWPRAVPVDDDI